MFFLKKKSFLKVISRLFKKRPWVILVVALVMFVSFTTAVVYEQYVMNQDNLAEYLPPDTVFYFHANTLKSSFINKSWSDFFSTHPRFKKIWLNNWEEKYFPSWPRLNGSDHQEVAFALVPKGNSWQPILLLFLRSDQGINESISKWQAEGWRVARLDNVVAVSRQSFYQWNTGQANLAKVLVNKRIPLANQFYVYFAKDKIEQWLPSLTDNKLLLDFFSYWEDSNQSAWYFFVRQNGLLITDNPSLLAEVKWKNKTEWIDQLSGEDTILLKNINLRLVWDFLLKNQKFLARTKFDLLKIYHKIRSRYGFDVLNSLILKSSGPANIYIGNFGGIFNNNSKTSYIFEFPVSYDFPLSAWEDFFKTAAGFYFPVEIEKKLPDGTKYRVKQARDPKSLNIKRKNFKNIFVLNSIVVDDIVWDWFYVYKSGRLWVANDKDMLISILSGQVKKTKKQDYSFCPISAGSYLEFLPDFNNASRLGINFILISQNDLGLLICAQ